MLLCLFIFNVQYTTPSELHHDYQLPLFFSQQTFWDPLTVMTFRSYSVTGIYFGSTVKQIVSLLKGQIV